MWPGITLTIADHECHMVPLGSCCCALLPPAAALCRCPGTWRPCSTRPASSLLRSSAPLHLSARRLLHPPPRWIWCSVKAETRLQLHSEAQTSLNHINLHPCSVFQQEERLSAQRETPPWWPTLHCRLSSSCLSVLLPLCLMRHVFLLYVWTMLTVSATFPVQLCSAMLRYSWLAIIWSAMFNLHGDGCTCLHEGSWKCPFQLMFIHLYNTTKEDYFRPFLSLRTPTSRSSSPSPCGGGFTPTDGEN